MKKTILFLLINFQFAIFNANAQAPEAIAYQAVARDNANNLIANQAISLRFTIHHAAPAGLVVYQETQIKMTNSLGLFTANIGEGITILGLFSAIDWGNGSKFLQVEMDTSGGFTFIDMGTEQMLSVPYALYSKICESTLGINGTLNYVSKFTTATTLGSSLIYDNGTNVGIGTTGPLAKLDVNSSASGAAARFNSASDMYLGLYEGNVYRGYVGSFYGNDVDVDLGSASGDVHLVTGSSINLTARGGNIGIGTTIPSVKLDVNKTTSGLTAKFNAFNQVYLGMYENNIFRGYFGSFYGNDEDIDVGSEMGSVHLVTNGTIDLTAQAGDIGIGTTAPSAKLDINSTSTGQVLRLNAADQVFMGLWEGGGYRGYVGSYYGALPDVDLGSLGGSVHLVTGNSIDLTANAGKIGIGTTDPQRDLQVYQQSSVIPAIVRVTASSTSMPAGIELERFAANNQWRIVNQGSAFGVAGNLVFQTSFLNFGSPTDQYELNASYFRPVPDNTSNLGQSNHRWIDVWSVDGSINTSDAKDKTKIKNLKYGLNEVMKLRPVTFQWKDREEPETKIGLIAQELQQVLPEVVRDYEYETNPETRIRTKVPSARLGVFYSDLIPVLVKSIQEQQKQIEEQNTKIEEQELRIKKLESLYSKEMSQK